MKLTKLSTLILLLALVLSIGATTNEEDKHYVYETPEKYDQDATLIELIDIPSTEADQFSSLHRIARQLSQKKHSHRLTCNKFPKICHAKGSPGPHCCKKKCVNILTDRHNCGKCGMKCKYGEICCRGKCVNPSFNKRHCGGCNNRCKNGGLCVFGLCNYA